MLQYEIMSCSAHPSISHRQAQRLAALACVLSRRVLSERVPRDSQTSALSGSVRSASHFAGSVPARIKCLAPVAAHHDMTVCLCVSLYTGRGVLDEHACSCVAQCKISGPAQRGAVWVAQQHAHAGLLSRRQEAGPDYGNEIDLRQIQSFRLHSRQGEGRSQAQQ